MLFRSGNNLRIGNLSDEQKQNIKSYILSYPYKYSKLLFFKNRTEDIFSAAPIKVFSGEVEISFDILKPTQVSKEIQKFLTIPKSNIDTVFIPDKNFTNQFLNILDRKSTRLNSSHTDISRMPSSA